MTHAALVERAVRWLRNSAVVAMGVGGGNPYRTSVRCGRMVFAEHHSFAPERPDAIGWFSGGRFSILIEAKANTTDFAAERRKRFRRRPESGAGRFRYYLTPPGLLSVEQLPLKWGLLEWDGGRRVMVLRLARLQPYNASREVQMLYAELRRRNERAIQKATS